MEEMLGKEWGITPQVIQAGFLLSFPSHSPTFPPHFGHSAITRNASPITEAQRALIDTEHTGPETILSKRDSRVPDLRDTNADGGIAFCGMA